MYVPPAFAEMDTTVLHDFMVQNSFATLVSVAKPSAVASHLPLLLDRSTGPYGRLIGHMARANPHWEQADGQEVLAIFTGPHAYISPSWYHVKNAVPTWNYIAVHAYGTFRLNDNRDRTLEIVRDSVESYEAKSKTPWSLGDADAEFIDRLLDAIVGFDFDIQRIEGAWKLSQNHAPERRQGVIHGLKDAGEEQQRQIAELMSSEPTNGDPSAGIAF
ncbi:Protease synthase and sporulation protein PAI 2 [Symmachiella macrocystis]|uniref:Protease synthase and sporulation protein PAI 2 n=1 Tax=Symmachiella macrocystis TaxID=2527985 RepID=A0A5C6BKE6_9PLAN|nr:FMN-binding negative transcriptional regulator [Symmachiella macrocystis]TWU12222.1 Protease synthase and sporulation protein PAI 2 [Symmachiella macrocystis]